MNIVIANRQRTKKIDTRLFKKVMRALFAELEIKNAELGINLVDAKEMVKVNRQFLRHEDSTDVITFNYDNSETRSQTKFEVKGELFICVDEAILQARDFKTRWQSEMVRYTVHGILHLLGHDDLRTDLRRTMKREENRLMLLLAKRFSLAQLARAAKLAA